MKSAHEHPLPSTILRTFRPLPSPLAALFTIFWDGQRGVNVLQILQKHRFRGEVTGYQDNIPDNGQGLGSGLWPLQIKALMGRGKFDSHYPQSPLIGFSSYALTSLPQMSPSGRPPTVFFPPGLKGWLNSDPFWIDGATCSALRDETLSLFEGAPTLLEGPIASPIQRLFPSLDDDRVGYPSNSRDIERSNDVDSTPVGSDVPLGIHPDDLYVTFSLPPHQPSRVTEPHPRLVALAVVIRPHTLSCIGTGMKLAPRPELWPPANFLPNR